MGEFKGHHMDLHYVLRPFPLAHYCFCGSCRDSKQNISYRDIRKVIVIHDIIVISHNPNPTAA